LLFHLKFKGLILAVRHFFGAQSFFQSDDIVLKNLRIGSRLTLGFATMLVLSLAGTSFATPRAAAPKPPSR
jgi:hypothetical protein